MWACPRCCAAYDDGRFCPIDGVALRAQEFDVPGLHLDRELGRGLTGVVWRAHAANGDLVAVKILHREWAEHAEMRARFDREVAAAAVVMHPGVVAPLAVGALDDGRPYLIMELVDGPALEDVLALGPLPERRALAIGLDLANALAAVHRAGVVHRDVKPGNVRIGRDGRAHLLDFGVARRLDIDEARLTNGGLTVGTPHYMAPEQCNGDEVSGYTDVYALGVLLYRMLSGAVPFDGAAVAVMLAHTARPAPRVRTVAPEISPALDELVHRCLAKRAGDRPDATSLARALLSFDSGLAGARPALRTSGSWERGEVDPHGATRVFEEATRARFARAATVPVQEPARLRRGPPAPSTVITSVVPLVRRSRAPGILGTMLGVAAAAAVMFGASQVGGDLGDRMVASQAMLVVAGQMPVTTPPTPPTPPRSPEAQRYLIAADGGIALRLGTPFALVPGVALELTIEAWDDDGRPLDTTDLVVTFAGPRGAVVGLAAEPTRDRGVYRVRTRFDIPGDWTVRVFPPIGDAMVTFHVDVGRPIPTS